MKLPTPCGHDCVFSGVDEQQVFSLTVSDREEYSCIDANRVLKIIPERSHGPAHPLHIEQDRTNTCRRRALLEELMCHPCPHVLPVSRVCSCSFESPVLTGEPLRDFGLGPDGNALVPPALRKPRWPPELLETYLRDLLDGLLELHGRGIAHGDPVLLNAFVSRSLPVETALWVDLSSIREGTDEARATDVAAFIELCLWPMLLDSEFSSVSLVRDIARVNSSAPNVLCGLREVLSVRRTDYDRANVRERFIAAVAEYDPLGRQDYFGRIHRRLCSAMAPAYALDYTVTDGSVRYMVSMLDAERTRNAMFEEERSRLLYLKFQRENDELRSWSAELERSAGFHRKRATHLEQELTKTADMLTELQAYARELRSAVEYHHERSERFEREFLAAGAAIERFHQQPWYRRMYRRVR